MKTSRNSKQRPDLGLIALLLAMIAMAAVGWFLHDFKQIPYRQLGALVWAGATTVAFIFGLLYFAQFVLPVRNNVGWFDGVWLLVWYYLVAAYRYLTTLTASPVSPQKRTPVTPPDPRTATLSDSFHIVRAGIVPSYELLTLLQGSGFSRVAGPGFVMLYRKEFITHVIDLRQQSRSQAVTANTRDAIPVETNISVTFRVRQTTDGAVDLIYPFDREAVFAVSSFKSIDERGRVWQWTTQLTPKAAALLVKEMARYNLNQLQETGTAINARREIQQSIKAELEKIVEPHGIEILSVGLGGFSLPKEIVAQRIKLWQSEWQRRIELQQAEGNAEVTRRLRQARARAQIEIIQKIAQSIDSMRRYDNASLTEIITLRMIEALEEATSESSLHALVPQHVMANLVMEASSQMQAWLNRPPQDSSS